MRYFAFSLLALIVVSCGGGEEPSTSSVPPTANPATELEDARARWVSAGLGTYRYVFADDCGECLPEQRTPRAVVVWNETEFDPADAAPSITEVFAEIDAAIAAGSRVDVSYHPDYGYPIDVAIDMHQRPVDGGTHWRFNDFAPALPGEQATLEGVRAAEALWRESRPLAYEFTSTIFCECELDGSLHTVVEGNRIVESSAAFGGSVTASPITIEEMFRDLERLVSSADGVTEGGVRFTGSAKFDERLGYPIWVGLDIEVLDEAAELADLPTRLVFTITELQLVTTPRALPGLEQARAQWAAAGMASYQYELTVHDVVSGGADGPYVVLVEQGVVVSVARDDGEPILTDLPATTVEELFDLIERWRTNGRETEVIFHTQLGYPVVAAAFEPGSDLLSIAEFEAR